MSTTSALPGRRPPCPPAARLVAAISLAFAPLAAAPPEVDRVDPPGWWADHSLRPVRLLLRGRGLLGASVTVARGNSSAANFRGNERGTSLLLDLEIPPETPPGPITLQVTTPGGRTSIPFEIHRRLPAEGRFQGLNEDDAIYLVMIDRFSNGDPGNDEPPRAQGLTDRALPRHYHGGDLQGVIDHLPWIRDLGATAIWLTPWYDNADRVDPVRRYDGLPFTDYHGYGPVDLYAVDEHFGDLARLTELVDRAHALGLKVVQDQVANHVGPFHPWTSDPPTATWFHGTASKHANATGRMSALSDVRTHPELAAPLLEGWFADLLPDLNQDDEDVARYLIQCSLWWIERVGLDAVRLDTVPYVPASFWKRWSEALRQARPGLRSLGEVLDHDPVVVSPFQRGTGGVRGVDTGIDLLFDFPGHRALRDVFLGSKPFSRLADILAADRLYSAPGSLVTFLGLHDLTRFAGEPGATPELARLAFTWIFTARGIPLIYSGDEIALEGGNDPDNRRDFPGGWRGDPRSAFEPRGRRPAEEALLERVQTLGRLRRELAPLRRGSVEVLHLASSTLVLARVYRREVAIAAWNLDRSHAALDLPEPTGAPLAEGTARDHLGGAAVLAAARGRLRLDLPARSAAVFSAACQGPVSR